MASSFCLSLGTMLSGKSTLYKNFRIRFDKGFDMSTLESYKEIIQSNAISAMKILLVQMKILQNPAVPPFTDLNSLVRIPTRSPPPFFTSCRPTSLHCYTI